MKGAGLQDQPIAHELMLWAHEMEQSEALNRPGWIMTVFREVRPVRGFGLAFDAPVVASADLWALALSVAAIIAIFRLKAGMVPMLAACSAIGIGLYLLGVRS
jgi:chromate transporter